MSVVVTLNGVQYTLPSPGDSSGWAAALNAYLQAIPAAVYQPNSGTSLPLTADLDLGAAFGLLAAYFKTRTASPAQSGIVRLARTDQVAWRNAANGADLSLGAGGQNQLQFNGNDVTGNPMAAYNSSAGQTFTTGVAAQVNFGTQSFDTDGNGGTCVTTGASWKFTVPTGKAGKYLITATVTPSGAIASGTTTLIVEKNGATPLQTLWRSAGAIPSTVSLSGQAVVSLVAGDYVDIRFSQSSGGNISLTASGLENYVAIYRLVP